MVLLRRLQSVHVPSFFLCPITLDIMKDPVTLCTGITYDRSSIERWLDDGNLTCPATNQLLESTILTPNHTLRRLIQDWCVKNQAYGVERIATPKTPAKPEEVRMMLEDLKNGINVHDTVLKVRSTALDKEKNKRLVASCGAVQVLLPLLDAQKLEGLLPGQEWLGFMEDVLSTVVLLSSCDGNRSRAYAVTPGQIVSLCRVLKLGSMESKVNAASVLDGIASTSDLKLALEELESVLEVFVEIVKERRCPKAVKASLKSLQALCSIRKNRARVTEAGGVDALVALLPETDSRGALERALRVLEQLASCAEGREAISGNEMAISALFRIFGRASAASIEYGVVILYMLSEYSVNASEVRKAIVQAGGFSRLLLVLQSGCSQRTKDKAMKLLKRIRPIWLESPNQQPLSSLQAEIQARL